MPTIILLDVSLSMIKPVSCSENSCESITLLQLATNGINYFLDYLAANEKLEFVSLVTFSSSYEVVVNFTRDFDQIKTRLAKIEEQDKTSLEAGLTGVANLVVTEWGTCTPCSVVLFTDGSVTGINPRASHFPLPFPFPGKLHVVCLTQPQNPGVSIFHKLVEIAGNSPGTLLTLEPGPMSLKSMQMIVQKLAESAYATYVGQLKCGNLTAKISLYPPPGSFKGPMNETITRPFSDTIEVTGFIDLPDLASPMAVSRHLVSPLPTRKLDSKNKVEVIDVEEETDDGKIPSFCVLFHGALKVENVGALCTVGEDWFGVLYSWADSKKKSNLMLTVFEPGPEVVPWLGDLRYLATLDEYSSVSSLVKSEPPSFPVRPAEKRSYSQSAVVWVRRAGLQSDIQKILRHSRKMPEKTQQFYKELNRVRRAAVSFGFIEMLEGIALILERECLVLPSTAHPECALQMNHSVAQLRRPYCREYKYLITPLKTSFQTDND